MEACCSTAKKTAAGGFDVRGREVSHHASEGCEAAQQELGNTRLRDDAGDGGGAAQGAQPAAGGEDAPAQGATQDGCALRVAFRQLHSQQRWRVALLCFGDDVCCSAVPAAACRASLILGGPQEVVRTWPLHRASPSPDLLRCRSFVQEEEAREEAVELFKEIDADGNGFVSKSELRIAMSARVSDSTTQLLTLC